MRDRFSTATYCDFCGRGLNECADMVAAPLAHICDGCVAVAASIIEQKRVLRASGQSDASTVSPAPLAIALQIDFEQQARSLKRALSDNHAYPAAGGGAGIDNGALPLIEGTMRAVAMLAIKFSRQQQDVTKNG